MRNVELKVRCPDLDAVRRLSLDLGAEPRGMLRQVDTYFRVPRGRLKLREEGEHAQLIRYARPDEAGARLSEYDVLHLDGDTGRRLRGALAEALDVLVEVRKRRELLICRRTRIHLDEVEGLGAFVELETVVTDQSLEEARAECDELARALGLASCEPVAGSYSDPLLSTP